MKKIASLGFSSLLILALAVPGLSQQPQPKSRVEYDTYIAFFNERVPAKKAELGEKFMVDHKDSLFRLDAYTLLIGAYTQAQNWAKVQETADKFGAEFPNAEVNKKVFVFENAMAAGQQANSFDKALEYGDKVLAAQPDNVSALITVSGILVEKIPTDEAAKNAALARAYDLASKAIEGVTKIFSAPKPPNFTDEQWNREKSNLLGQLSATRGYIHLNKQEYDQAILQYEEALKNTPRDGVARYRMGLAFQSLAAGASRAVIDAVNAENEAKTTNADKFVLDELVAKRQAVEEDARAKRDRAIDELATAVAIGGPASAPAREQLEKLYKVKNNDSLDGLDTLIAQKKGSTPE